MYTCMCVHICIYVCAHVFIHTYIHRNIQNPKHALINTDTHTSPVDGYAGCFLISLGHTLRCTAHPGDIYIYILHLSDYSFSRIARLHFINFNIKNGKSPFMQHHRDKPWNFPSNTEAIMLTLGEKVRFHTRDNVQETRSIVQAYRKHSKRLVVSTNERLSECDGTPCSLYCKLTLGEDSPGSLAQRKPGDKLDAIHHSPTPAPELLVPPTPHPLPKQTHPSSAMQKFIFRARTAAARGRVSA